MNRAKGIALSLIGAARSRLRRARRMVAGADRADRDGAGAVVDRHHDRDREGLLQGIRHQGGGRGPGFLHRCARRGGAEPAAGGRGRHLGGLFQRHREEPAGHHRDRPGEHAAQPPADRARRPQGQDPGHRPAQGPPARQQLARRHHQLRDRQDFRQGRARFQGCRHPVHPLHPDERGLRQQGGRRRLHDPAVRLAGGRPGPGLGLRGSGRVHHARPR